MMLVELCAGSAAISLRWLRSDAVPALAYQGGKRGYADQILRAFGLCPGGGQRDGEVLLVEPGPWGEAWDLWRTAEGRADTVKRLGAWQDIDPRDLWERVRSEPVPKDQAKRVARWAVLQFWSFGRKPVYAVGKEWAPCSFNRAEPYRREYCERNQGRRGRATLPRRLCLRRPSL